jgi:hypothetical protein
VLDVSRKKLHCLTLANAEASSSRVKGGNDIIIPATIGTALWNTETLEKIRNIGIDRRTDNLGKLHYRHSAMKKNNKNILQAYPCIKFKM